MATIVTEPARQGTPPAVSSLAIVNDAGATLEDDPDGLFLAVAEQTPAPVGLLVPALAPPFVFTIELEAHAPTANSSPIGIMARERSSGKYKTFGLFGDWISSVYFAADNTWDLSNAPGGDGMPRTHLSGGRIWLSWVDDGTTVTMRSSPDGRHWRPDCTDTRTTWCTPDQIGVCVSANNDWSPVYLKVLNWNLTRWP